MHSYRLKILVFIILTIFSTIKLNAQSQLNGATYSYANEDNGLSSYFTFISSTDVAWYLGAPSRFIFPVGYGSYNPQYGTITFSKDKITHKKISLYYGDQDIVFKFIAADNIAKMNMLSNDSDILELYKNGATFTATKELYSLVPNSYLIGTSWVFNKYSDNTASLYFKSRTEVLINGESHLYVCLDNFVSIKSGDNIGDENLTGTFNSKTMYLYRDGVDGAESDDNNRSFRFERVE